MKSVRYIGRIHLSKEDSAEWSDKPEYMYVTCDNGNRADVNNATLFMSLGACKRELSRDFVRFKHNKFDSQMEVLEVEMSIKNVEQI